MPVNPITLRSPNSPEPSDEDTFWRRVLLVDDDRELTSVLTSQLARRGWRVFAAPDGLRALQLLEDRPVAAVVSDLNLGPGPSGIVLLEAVRRTYPEARKLILLTGEVVRDDTRARLIAIGAVVVAKGSPFSELVERLEGHAA